MPLCASCGHARVSHGRAGDDCRTCPVSDPCLGWDTSVTYDQCGWLESGLVLEHNGAGRSVRVIPRDCE